MGYAGGEGYWLECPFCGRTLSFVFWDELEEHAMKCREGRLPEDWRSLEPRHIVTCEESAGAVWAGP